MTITLIFLISCIITARLFEKKHMRVASVAYSVLFVFLLVALLLTSDYEPISNAWSRIMGENVYLQAKDALLYAIHSAGYGTCIIFALLLTLILQLLLVLTLAVTGIVRILISKNKSYQSKKENYVSLYTLYKLFIQIDFNLIYCRMLN